jgi:bile acid-coenzyme A ligase
VSTTTAATIQRPVSYGRLLTILAQERGDDVAIISAPLGGEEERISWAELERRANRTARLLAARGVGEGDTVAIGFPNSPEHVVVSFAAWKLGALRLTLRAALPPPERDAILALARPTLTIADWAGLAFPSMTPDALDEADRYPADPLPDRTPNPGTALASGGSTGRPKIIVTPGPLERAPGAVPLFLTALGFRPGQTQLVVGPLYHSAPSVGAYNGLLHGHTLVIMDRFDPTHAADLIARHRVGWIFCASTIMQRIANLPDFRARDFSSLEALASTAAPCPPWLKRAWIERIGPERVYELYSMTEGVGGTLIRGDEWLAHPGSVGRDLFCDIRILDPAGRDLPRGEIGEIFLRLKGPAGPTHEYIGSPPAHTTPDGFTTMGDLGWLDADGYLYIADRRVDLIITGGANVYPAEVEAALTSHPAVGDVVVIGLPDAEWGKRVHAIVQPRDAAAPPTAADLDRHCRERLASFKVPKTYEFVGSFLRTEAGKVRRAALVAEREGGQVPGMIAVPAQA